MPYRSYYHSPQGANKNSGNIFRKQQHHSAKTASLQRHNGHPTKPLSSLCSPSPPHLADVDAGRALAGRVSVAQLRHRGDRVEAGVLRQSERRDVERVGERAQAVLLDTGERGGVLGEAQRHLHLGRAPARDQRPDTRGARITHGAWITHGTRITHGVCYVSHAGHITHAATDGPNGIDIETSMHQTVSVLDFKSNKASI